MSLSQIVDFLNSHVLVAVLVMNTLLSAATTILGALGVVAPAWFSPLQKAIDWLSANVAHPTTPPKA